MIRNILTIAGRDFKSTVTSPMFFLIMGLCSVIWSYKYLRSLSDFAAQSLMAASQQFGGGQGINIHYGVFVNHMSLVNVVFILAIPALTMRLVAEEKKMGTYDLLLTSPITATEIAVGKFLAGYGTALCLLLVALVYPLGTLLVADFNVGQLMLTYLGFGLLMGAYVAVGLFASSLTSSAVLSLVMGLVFNIILLLGAELGNITENEFATRILDHLSVQDHLFNFIRGTFNISSLVFFLSLVALFVFFAQRVIESSRWRS